MKSVEIIHGFTKDKLNLQGFHWSPASKKTCVICIHGMSGNIIENYFAEVLGDNLSTNGYGFIYGHNRGYSHVNDIRTSGMQKNGSPITRRIGASFEIFEESIYDIDLWVDEAQKLGYKNIILMGHSLGCNKVIYYIAETKAHNIAKIILASPPDMVGLAKLQKYQPNYLEMLEEAKNNIKENQPKKILSSLLWDWYNISSETFLNFFQDTNSIDNIPLLRNPDKFEQLSRIDVPIFAFMGEYDDITINTLEDDLNRIKEKATNCLDFRTTILEGASHTYDNKEMELSQIIIDWLNK